MRDRRGVGSSSEAALRTIPLPFPVTRGFQTSKEGTNTPGEDMSRIKTILLGLFLAAAAGGSAYAVESWRADPDASGYGIPSRTEAETLSASLFVRPEPKARPQATE